MEASQQDEPDEAEEAAAAYLARHSDEHQSHQSFRKRTFFHVGFTNYKTWRMSVLRLVQKPGQDSVQTLCLEELGKICTGDRGVPPDTLEEAHVTSFADLSGDICTLLQAVCRIQEVLLLNDAWLLLTGSSSSAHNVARAGAQKPIDSCAQQSWPSWPPCSSKAFPTP